MPILPSALHRSSSKSATSSLLALPTNDFFEEHTAVLKLTVVLKLKAGGMLTGVFLGDSEGEIDNSVSAAARNSFSAWTLGHSLLLKEKSCKGLGSPLLTGAVGPPTDSSSMASFVAAAGCAIALSKRPLVV